MTRDEINELKSFFWKSLECVYVCMIEMFLPRNVKVHVVFHLLQAVLEVGPDCVQPVRGGGHPVDGDCLLGWKRFIARITVSLLKTLFNWSSWPTQGHDPKPKVGP